MNPKKIKQKSFLLICSLFVLLPQITLAAFKYTPMEEIPGFGRPDSYEAYILALYKFGLWTVGISAVFMISVGAFMYITSAGNTSTMGRAKEIIFDAIAGVILALLSYVLLYTINPALVSVNAPSITALPGTPGSPGTPKDGVCQPVSTGDCSISNLQSGCFGSNAEKMSQICSKESGGNPANISQTDKCKDGNYFSVGLFQINMITSASSIGCNGSDIFTVNKSSTGPTECAKFTGSGGQGTCLECKTNSNNVSYCSSWDCQVKDQTKYNDCLDKLKNGQTNITIACSLSGNGSSVSPWLITANSCGIK